MNNRDEAVVSQFKNIYAKLFKADSVLIDVAQQNLAITVASNKLDAPMRENQLQLISRPTVP